MSEDLQKRVMMPLLERIGRKELPALNRYFDFSMTRKINAELKTEGWRP